MVVAADLSMSIVAEHEVFAGTAVQRVVFASACQLVVPRAAVQVVVAVVFAI
ncbi:hypothetical protein D3C87_1087750 [compost metagenome]